MHGEVGMITAENQRPISIEIASSTGFTRPPLHDFFMTRYLDAYAAEISAFVNALNTGQADIPQGIDGLNALVLAEAALQSATTGEAVYL